jgi:hypothetical protein
MRIALLTLLILTACATQRGDASGASRLLATPAARDAGKAAPQAFAAPDYFPAVTAAGSGACGPDAPPAPAAPTASKDQWYSRHLAAAREPSLHLASQSAMPAGRTTLRFTWLRSFHAPIVIRIETEGPGRHRLVAKRLSGAGGYDPGTVEATLERPLTGTEAVQLETVLRHTSAFDPAPDPCEIGMDGAQWIFESVDRRGYHFSDHWTPREGPAYRLGRMLMTLTGWKFGEVY